MFIDSLKKRFGQAVGFLILVLVAVLILIPVIWLLLSSVKADSDYMAWPIQFLPSPSNWHLDNYLRVFSLPTTPILPIIWRTFVLGLTVAIITAFTSAMAGYGFARYRDVNSNKRLFGLVIAMLIVPGIVTLIPQFIVYSHLKFTGTYWPWILGALSGSPIYIFLYRQFFLGFPKELEEAAEIDGCGPFRIFLQILLPNSRPVIATSLIFGFNGLWGDYLTPSLYLPFSRTLLGVAMATSFVDPQGRAIITVSLAATVIYILPLIIVFFFFQRYILKGLITSGLKG